MKDIEAWAAAYTDCGHRNDCWEETKSSSADSMVPQKALLWQGVWYVPVRGHQQRDLRLWFGPHGSYPHDGLQSHEAEWPSGESSWMTQPQSAQHKRTRRMSSAVSTVRCGDCAGCTVRYCDYAISSDARRCRMMQAFMKTPTHVSATKGPQLCWSLQRGLCTG